ncbi:MAG TPA: hypothetical protein VLI90_14220 [Tepidisphaeraceae bacterium]|nr:hypothetical protein [Tepidisphaeraceae bacterium]
MKSIDGQPSWRIASRDVEAYVTVNGGHLAPVTFDRRGMKIRPYSIAPWGRDRSAPRSLPMIIRALRGDFFCMPFGGNEQPFGKERFPVHGETANAKWKLQSQSCLGGVSDLRLTLRTKIRTGQVQKLIRLIDGHNAVYCRHKITEASGPMNFGHHAMLKFPDEAGSGVVSTSPFVFGQVYLGAFEKPEEGGYSALKRAAEFTSLEAVPGLDGSAVDVTRYPARRGFEELLMVINDPKVPLAWTAATFPKERYAWFALKDPAVLRGTILWVSNGGRHYAPWSGRHINVMGLEDVTGHFHDGIAASAAPDNSLRRRGYPTSVQLSPDFATVVNYVMAIAKIPVGFDRVERIEPSDDGKSVTLISRTGKRATAPINVDFVRNADH